MALSIIIFIGIIILAVLVLKFLGGMLRTIISTALFIIAAAFLLKWFTGTDLFGIAGFVTGLLP